MGGGASKKKLQSEKAALELTGSPVTPRLQIASVHFLQVADDTDDAPYSEVVAHPAHADVPLSPGSAAAQAATQDEVLHLLKTARCHRFRLLPAWVQQQLVLSTAIVEYAPGAEVEGRDCWLRGCCFVLRGEALIDMQGSDGAGERTIICQVQAGDSWGWSGKLKTIQEGANAFLRCNPRVYVGLGGLRIARLGYSNPVLQQAVEGGSVEKVAKAAETEPSAEEKGVSTPRGRTKRIATVLGNSGTLTELIGDVWMSTTPLKGGIADLKEGYLKAHFLAALWLPFLDRLDQQSLEMRERTSKGFRIHERFPLEGHQIPELCREVLALTELWYGTARGGNLSVFYRWFMQSMEDIGVTAYKMANIPVQRSADGWSVVVDGNSRKAALQGMSQSKSSYTDAGGVGQSQGLSAIANTVLRNIFTPYEARELCLGKRMRKALCRFIALRQRIILRKLSQSLGVDLEEPGRVGQSTQARRMVKAILRSITKEELNALSIDPDGTCFRLLAENGSILAGYGQLSAEFQKALWEQSRELMWDDRFASLKGNQDSDDVFVKFVTWAKEHPGEFFEQDKLRHYLVTMAGLISGNVIFFKRSAMEKMTMARFFPITWQRTQPLWGVQRASCEAVEHRHENAKEVSHVRANECPYAPLHGMSLSGGCLASDKVSNGEMRKKGRARYSVLVEMQWVSDPTANIENWGLTDIEKIVQESWFLNPHGPEEIILPLEGFLNIGQNPKVGSSIKQTQHTQLCEGSIANYPILNLSSDPRYSKKLQATVDLVSVCPAQNQKEGTFLKVTTEKPTDPQVLSLLVQLRLSILLNFGGAEMIDFFVTVVPNLKGGFVIIFAPLPQLEKITDEPADDATWLNRATGETTLEASLEEARIDFGKGVGHFLTASRTLRDQLLTGGEDYVKRVWAFNRVPGCREAIQKFLSEQRVFE